MKTKSILAGLLMAATSLWNAQSWQVIGDQADMSGSANTIAISMNNNMIYSAGQLRYGALTTNQVFKWDFTEWAPLGNVDIGTANIKKIVLDNTDKVYMIGSFKDASNKYFVKYWNGTTWTALGNLKSATEFNDIATDGTNIYVAGNFVNTATGETCYINKWDGTSWSVVTQSNFNGVVRSIAFDAGNNLIVGGEIKNTLNYYGVFKISGASVSEVGKIRLSTPIAKVFYNKSDNKVIADTDGYGRYVYTPTSNNWTLVVFDGGYPLRDYESSGYYLLSYSQPYQYSHIYAFNANDNSQTYLSNTIFANDCKFDKFGYAVCSTVQGKVYRWSQKIGTGLATSETTAKSKITIYPNPSTGIVNISNKEKISSIEVYDAAGKLLEKAQPNTDKTQIDLSGKKGVYMIKATSTSGSDAQKVIIQ